MPLLEFMVCCGEDATLLLLQPEAKNGGAGVTGSLWGGAYLDLIRGHIIDYTEDQFSLFLYEHNIYIRVYACISIFNKHNYQSVDM